MNETLDRKGNVQQPPSDYWVILTVQGPSWLLVCFISLHVFISIWPTTIVKHLGMNLAEMTLSRL